MKVFHLSDLHIGLKLHQRDLTRDQEYILNQILEHAAAEKPDVVVIAGDVYDRQTPSPEAVHLYDQFTSRLHQTLPGTPVLVISGNHDNGTRLSVHSDMLKEGNLYVSGRLPQTRDERLRKVTLEDEHGPVNFYLLPYVRPGALRDLFAEMDGGEVRSRSYADAVAELLEREEIDERERNVLVSHQFYIPKGTDAASVEHADNEVAVGNVNAVPSELLKPFDYAALGHLHRPMRTPGGPGRYCGTPLVYSQSEIGQQKGIVVVELGEKGSVEVRILELQPLRQVRILEGSYEDLLKDHSDDYVYIRLTDEEELDVMDRTARLRAAYPNMLKLDMVRAEKEREARTTLTQKPTLMTPMDICLEFLGVVTERQEEILRSVIEEVEEHQ